MSGEVSTAGPIQSGTPGRSCTLRVEVVFRDLDERQADAVAASMIGRAHELANVPACECDVDVSVRTSTPAAADAPRDGAL